MHSVPTQPSKVFRRFAAMRCACALLLMGMTLVVPPARASAAEAPASPLVFAGSGGNLALTRALVEAYAKVRPEVKIDVPASIGSTGAIRAAVDGAISVGLIGRPLQDEEQKLRLTVLPYARTVVDDDITSEDLVRIYKKAKTSWQDGHEIIVLTRQPGDNTLLKIGEAFPSFKEAYSESQQAKRWTMLYTDQEMHRLLAKTPYALGFADLGVMATEGLPIKALKVNGIAPTEEHVRSGQYPLVHTLAYVFRQDKLSPAAKAFIDFTRSAAGEAIIRANGYLPSE